MPRKELLKDLEVDHVFSVDRLDLLVDLDAVFLSFQDEILLKSQDFGLLMEKLDVEFKLRKMSIYNSSNKTSATQKKSRLSTNTRSKSKTTYNVSELKFAGYWDVDGFCGLDGFRNTS